MNRLILIVCLVCVGCTEKEPVIETIICPTFGKGWKEFEVYEKNGEFVRIRIKGAPSGMKTYWEKMDKYSVCEPLPEGWNQ